mgnify:CR=1 FL=1
MKYLLCLMAGATGVTTVSAYENPEVKLDTDKKRPNIVLIVADDLGYGDLSCYGATGILTPGMDRLAGEGIRFTQGFCTAATSTPSRYSVMTGRYPWTNPAAKILPGNAALIIDTEAITLPKVMKQAGYITGSVGKWHIGLGDGNVDWNKRVFPGASEIGYDYSFIQAATNDRVPCVYLENNKVVMNGSTVEIGRYPSNVTNDDLKWESQKQYNIGFDFGVLDNRFSITADFYYKRIDDMLLQVNIPSTSGYTKAWKNAGSMENKGMEFAINANWFKGAFNWSTDFNISFYKNKILSLDKGQYQQFYDRGINAKITSDVLLRVGMPVGIYYGYISDGTYNNDTEVINGYPGPNLGLGQLKVVDVNKDGVIDSNDRTPIADVNPKHTGGIGNTFSYKGFDLYAFFRWSYGNDVVNGNAYYLVGTTSINNVLKSVYKDVWSANTPTNNYPLYGRGTWGESVLRSDLVEDGSFLRLQTLTLGYTFPAKLTGKMGLSKMRIALTGTNLWLWTRYSGFDPEANTGYGTVARLAPGLDMSPYPRPRSFSLSIELGF